jgi:hypothetical protein
VLADEQGALVRLVPEERTRHAERDGAFALRVETGGQVGAKEALPGHGTRLEPWPARFGYTVVFVGDAERKAAASMRDHLPGSAPERVVELISWLERDCPSPVPEGTWHLGRLVAWYCPEVEAHALWMSILEEAKRALFRAVAEERSSAVLEASWWLSRAAFTEEDLYLAAAGLKRAGSSHAEAMLRAMLQEPPGPQKLQQELHKALKLLVEDARLLWAAPAIDRPAGFHPPRYPVLTASRESVRKLGLIEVHG